MKIIRKLGKGSYANVFLIEEKGKKYVVRKAVFDAGDTDLIKEWEILEKIKKDCDPYLLCMEKYRQEDNDEELKIIAYFYFKYNPNMYDMWNYLGENERKLTIPMKYIIIENLLLGLVQLHNLGIAHRDIKLDNLLLNPKTLATKYIDYGFACRKDVKKECSHRLVTVEYASPESLWLNKDQINFKVSTKIDVWALGIVILNIMDTSTIFDFIRIIKNIPVQTTEDWEKLNQTPRSEIKRFISKLTQKKVDKVLKQLAREGHPLFIKLVEPMLVVDWKIRFSAKESLLNFYTLLDELLKTKGFLHKGLQKLTKKAKQQAKSLRIPKYLYPWGQKPRGVYSEK